MHAGKVHEGCNKIRVHFYFWSRCCCVLLLLPTTSIRIEAERGTGYCFFLLRLRYDCCFLCVYSIAVAAVEKGCMPGKTNITFSFLVAALLPLFTHREGCAEKNKIDVPGTYTKFYFSFSVRCDIPTSAFFHSRAFCFRVNRLLHDY